MEIKRKLNKIKHSCTPKPIKNIFDLSKQEKYNIEYENYSNTIQLQMSKEIALLDEILELIYENESIYWFNEKRTELNNDIMKKVNSIITKKISKDYMTKLSLIIYERIKNIIKNAFDFFLTDDNRYNQLKSKYIESGQIVKANTLNLNLHDCFDIIECMYIFSEYERLDRFISLIPDYLEEIFYIFDSYQLVESDVLTEALIEEYYLLLLSDPFFKVSNNKINIKETYQKSKIWMNEVKFEQLGEFSSNLFKEPKIYICWYKYLCIKNIKKIDLISVDQFCNIDDLLGFINNKPAEESKVSNFYIDKKQSQLKKEYKKSKKEEDQFVEDFKTKVNIQSTPYNYTTKETNIWLKDIIKIN